jgi:prepilin-type N-terminal cleavage/methylation domain-containing protein
MTHIPSNHEKGFTLVELAIVLVIVGLLVAGVLKGQELIANSQTTATISQLTGLEAATQTFQDKYRAFPGDMSQAQNRLPSCAAPCNNGTAPFGQLNIAPNAAPTAGDEGHNFFLHLLADGLISGFTGANNTIFGEGYPSAPVGGGFQAGFAGAVADVGPATPAAADFRNGHYVSVIGTAAAALADGNGILTASQADQIDVKLDDGNPSTGYVYGSNGCVATVGGEDIYASTAANADTCSVLYRISN